MGEHPKQLSLPFALWNRRAVMQLIHVLFGIGMPIRTVGESAALGLYATTSYEASAGAESG
jgi:hypothetical protein